MNKEVEKKYDIVDFMKDKDELERKIEKTKEEIDNKKQDLYNYETALQNLINNFLFKDENVKMRIERECGY